MFKKQQLIALGGFTSLFSSSGSHKQPPQGTCHDSAWQWASCGLHPRTLSFRQQQQQEDADGYGRQHHDNDNHTAAATMMNSAAAAAAYSTDSLQASVDYSFSTAAPDAEAAAEAAVTRAVRSDRLLFEPEEGASSSSLKAASSKPNKVAEDSDDKDTTTTTSKAKAAFGGAMAMSVESEDPYHDFRESMEAMVMSQQGAVSRDWRWMEEMLGWYLTANGKSTHGLIVNAFVDLLVALSSTATTQPDSSSSPATTPADSSSSPATPAAANCCCPSSSSDCSCSCSSSSL